VARGVRDPALGAARLPCLLVVWFCLLLCPLGPNPRAAPHPLRVLVAGFEPFGGLKHNPTQELADKLDSISPALKERVQPRGVVLPVTYDGAWPRLLSEIDEFRPHVVLAFGLGAHASGLRLETTARNHDSGLWDNLGRSRKGAIIPDGPGALPSGLPLEALRRALHEGGFDVQFSDNAGGYLCNHIFYRLTAYAASRPEMRAGFIHVPQMPLEDRPGAPGLLRALELILETLERRATLFGVYEFEPLEDDVLANLARIENVVSRMADSHGVDFHLFPEMALTGFVHASPKALLERNPELTTPLPQRRLADLAANTRSHVALGLPLQDNGVWHNAFRVFAPDDGGSVAYTYRKNHLYGSDHEWAAPGLGDYPVFRLPCGDLGAVICHDLVHPAPYRAYATQSVDLLLVATNWIGERDGPYRYLHRNFAPTTLVSDRKGREEGIVFPGSTGILLQGRSPEERARPRDLGGNVRGVLYLCL
jgi:pyroglutamyl-peptidase